MSYQYSQQQGYNPQQQGGYVQPQQPQLLQQQQYQQQYQQQQQQQYQQQYQQRPPPPQQQQQQPPSQYNYPAMQMNVAKEQVAPRAPNNAPREWRFGLFDCFADMGLCFKTWCCPCITYGENKGRLNGNPNPESCSQDTLLFCCVQSCTGFGFVLGAMQRSEIRTRYNIEGGGAGDFCTHYCCGCCALIQESREIQSQMQNI